MGMVQGESLYERAWLLEIMYPLLLTSDLGLGVSLATMQDMLCECRWNKAHTGQNINGGSYEVLNCIHARCWTTVDSGKCKL